MARFIEMKIHEYQARELFKKAGIPFSHGQVARDVSQAQQIAQDIGFPVVLKAQVLVGGRGKAGGVKVVKSADELKQVFPQIKNLKIKGCDVEQILVTTAVDIKKEYYLAITIDNAQNDIVLIGSCQGGVDIEETAQKNPEQIHKCYLNGKKEIDHARWPSFISGIFPDASSQSYGTEIYKSLLTVFLAKDCSLTEINPFVLDREGNWMALDAKINFDDNALFRHPDIQALQDFKAEDPDELEAKRHDLSFVKMDGNIGCIVNGAGLAMATMDIIKLSGGHPANFLDVGGSSNPEKVLNALRIILKNSHIKAILINIFGGITRCDDIAKGILEAQKQIMIPVSLVVRLTGTNEQEGVAVLNRENIKTYSSMREAVSRVVELAR